MTMTWITATDGNGVDLHGLTDNLAEKDSDGRVPVWIYNDKESGFGETVGEITLRPLKQLPDGKFGA